MSTKMQEAEMRVFPGLGPVPDLSDPLCGCADPLPDVYFKLDESVGRLVCPGCADVQRTRKPDWKKKLDACNQYGV